MYDALHGEMIRRQVPARAGHHASLRDYEKAREQGADLQPMPTLFLVLDEFSELLSAKPEFADLFVMIGRLGRSLGVHILLASQRLEEGKLRGLDTHLSYRIGLRTFSAQESRVVLGVPDAYELPSAPGHGYVKFGTESMTRFRAAYVSGPASEDLQPKEKAGPQVVRQIVPYIPDYIRPHVVESPQDQQQGPENESQATLFDVVVKQLENHGRRCTRSGCRRWTRRPRWTNCCRPSPSSRPRPDDAARGLAEPAARDRRHRRQAVRSAPRPDVRRPVQRGCNAGIAGSPQTPASPRCCGR